MYLCRGRSVAISRAGQAAWARFASQDSALMPKEKPAKTNASPFGALDIRPVKRPDSAAYFMAKPKYNDLMAALKSIIQQHTQPNTIPKPRGVKLITQKKMEEKLELKLNENEYLVLAQQLRTVAGLKIADREEADTVQLYLNQFLAGYSHIEYVDETGEVITEVQGEKKKKKRPDLKACGRDELGRWFGGGRRKAARARAWLIPIPGPDPFKAMMWAAMNEVDAVAGEVEMIMRDVGLLSVSDELEKPDAEPATDADAADADAGADAAGAPRLDVPEPQFTTFGEVLVNGKPLADYFMRATDRESVIFPLVVSNKLGRYNAFVQVHGGGPTGQAEACQLAVARALYRSGRREHGAIKTAKLLIADHRMVERKKTGKPKARKSYTWVKR